MSCEVCCEKYNRKQNTPVNCPACELKSCRKCSETYLLSIFEEPHCMGCKAQWDRQFIDSWCTQVFRNNAYRKHREEVLFEKEKALFPQTQLIVEKELKRRKLMDEIEKVRGEVFRLWRHHGITHMTHQLLRWTLFVEGKYPDVRVVVERLENLYRQMDELRAEDESDAAKKFVRKCPTPECRGFLNREFHCSLCERDYCEKCNESTGEGHACDPETVKTIALINKDSKPCPKCGVVIHKLEGCTQMWCPSCHTAFNWRTGVIELGRIHNPHYLEFRRKGGTLSREHSDIPCGGTPTFAELRSISAPEELLIFRIEIDQFEREIRWVYDRPQSTDYPRRMYLMNQMSTEDFKKEIQKRDKRNQRNKELHHLFQMIVDTCGDFLRQYMMEQNTQRVVDDINGVIEYANEVIGNIHRRYKCYTPRRIEKIYC